MYLLILLFVEKWSRSSSRSSEVKTDLPYLLRNLRGPAPRHPKVQKVNPAPVISESLPRGPRGGTPSWTH